MGDWDDSEGEEEEEEEITQSPSAAAGGDDPFGDEDEDSDDAGNWDDSEEEVDEAAVKKDAGPKKGIKEIARAKRQKEQAARVLALKAERMELAIRAGRGKKSGGGGSAAAEPAKQEGPIGPVGEDGFERRTDPSDGVGYTFLEYLDAYGQEGENLWEVAGNMMMGKGGGLGTVQADSDMLFGGDDAGFVDEDDAPSSGSATLDDAIKYELMAESEFGAAADAIGSKFEQLIVSDKFVPFLGKWCAAMMAESKSEPVGNLIAEMTRVQNAAAKGGSKKGGAAPKGSAPARGLAAEGKSMGDMGAGGAMTPREAPAPITKKKSKKNFKKMTMGEEAPQGAAEDDFSESMDAFM